MKEIDKIEINQSIEDVASELHTMNKEMKHHSRAPMLFALFLTLAVITFASSLLGTVVANKYVGGKAAASRFVDPDKMFGGRAFAQNEILYGSKDAKIVFLNYSDTECPFCKAFHRDGFKKLREAYGDNKDIAIAYRHFPLSFHTLSPKESESTMCVRDQLGVKAYENYLNSIYDTTKSNNSLNPTELPRLAALLPGLNIDTFNKCVADGKFTQQVQDDIADGVAAGVTGTPHSLILIKTDGGYQILAKIEGARDFNYIDKVLKQAIAMVK